MTERVLRLPPATARERTLLAVPAARALTRPSVATRRPVHVAVTVGVTAGLYAVSLAGVTTLQAGTDARLSADRAPAAAAVAELRDTHAAVEAQLALMESSYAGAAATYSEIAAAIGAHEKSLAGLGRRVAAVEGSASSLRVPTVGSLPSVSSGTVYVTRPATNACTTGSGQPC
jgi:hypothetical protein